ncbi:MAG: carboxypeptidase regulatory-like domain-containing protein [Gemmatimonadota bacterium]
MTSTSRAAFSLVLAWLATAALHAALSPLAAQEPAGGGADDPYAACPAPDPDALSVSLHGVVTDEESDVALPGASVRLAYEPRADGGEPSPPREATADAAGHYVLCNLEAFARVRLTASHRGRSSDAERLTLEHPQRLDLEVHLGEPAYLVFSAVEAGTGAPIAGVRLEIAPLPLSGVSDSLGRAAFREVPPGSYRLRTHHFAYEAREDSIRVAEGQLAELRVALAPRAIAVEPIEVEITGRDPYLLEQGFYERQEGMDEGWFATKPDLEPYVMFRTLFTFEKELSIRYARNRIVLINGRPMSRLGFSTVPELNELPYNRVRGIEAYPCNVAAPRFQRWIPVGVPLGDCNLILIWTR